MLSNSDDPSDTHDGFLRDSDCKNGLDLCTYENSGDCNGHSFCLGWKLETEPASGDTESATATINSATAGLGGVVADGGEAANVAGETRPKNMKAVFIMRIE